MRVSGRGWVPPWASSCTHAIRLLIISSKTSAFPSRNPNVGRGAYLGHSCQFEQGDSGVA